MSNGDNTVGALQQVTRTTPIVFVGVADPIGAGFAQTLGHPGGNATGFLSFEYGISVKWLELLKEVVPNVRRTVVLRDPSVPVGAWAVRCNPGDRSIFEYRRKPNRRSRCRWNGRRDRSVRALLEWRARHFAWSGSARSP